MPPGKKNFKKGKQTAKKAKGTGEKIGSKKQQQQHYDESLIALKWREIEKEKVNKIFQKMVSPNYYCRKIGTKTDEVFFCSLKKVIV